MFDKKLGRVEFINVFIEGIDDSIITKEELQENRNFIDDFLTDAYWLYVNSDIPIYTIRSTFESVIRCLYTHGLVF